MKKIDNFNTILLSISKFNKTVLKKSPFLWRVKRPLKYGIEAYRCSGCNKVFNLKTGTIFNSSKLPFKKIFRLVYLLTSTDLEQKVIAKRCCTNVSTVVRFNTMIKGLK